MEGSIIYYGSADKSTSYFKSIGFPVPVHDNPSNHYLKLMNREGVIEKYIEQKKAYTDEDVDKEFEKISNKLLE